MSKNEERNILDLINLYLGNNNSRDELEVRFCTNRNNPLTKIKFDNVIKKLLSLGFYIDQENIYTLNIQIASSR